jgi:intergrase/recombinase
MGASRCVECGELRAKRGDSECPVYYLVRMLAEEHVAGAHDTVVNASCIDCTRSPEYVSELRRHRDAMRRTEDFQTARRALIKQLVGEGSPTGRLSTKKPVMQSIKPVLSGHIDHSQCDHEKTAKARSACRRARRTV